jgi:aryl-alcohol dehydrogenase-like predicted oxidoreductase
MKNNSTGIYLSDRVELGQTGLMVSRLSFGTGSNGWSGRSDQSDLGVDRFTNLLRMAYESGVNFWDTADAYGTHPHVARALQGIPRNKIVIATKTLSRKAVGVSHDIERFLKELGTDYIDIVLLHVMTHADWPRRYADAMNVLSLAKEQGKIRAVGVSCHSLAALKTTAETDWTDVVLARINYAGVNMDASREEVVPILKKLYASGKAVFGMKIVGNGKLISDVRSAIQFAFQLGVIHAITIGMINHDQLIENIRLVSEFSPKYPLHSL